MTRLERSRRRAPRLAQFTAVAMGCAAFGAPAAFAAITPVTSDGTGAAALAGAMLADATTLTTAGFDAVPPSGTPHGTADALSFFPTNGSSFGILTSGDVNLADDANNSGTSGASLGGANVRGNTDLDVTVLKLELTAPLGTNCLGLDFAFYSEEFPEYVGSSFSDGFVAELDSSTWSTSGSVITAPNNFAFDSNGDVVSINSTGATGMSLANAAGTAYDGATVLLKASVAVTPGAHTLYLSIFDQGDTNFDSAAFVDNIRFLNVANPATDCTKGATPVATTSTTYTGAASVQYSDAATLSGQLRDTTVTPDVGISGKQLDFTLGTQTTGGSPTDASGDVSAPPLTVTQQPGSVTTVQAAFAGDASFPASADSKPFAINKEDCTLSYSGDTLVAPATNTTLAADLGEPDTSLGDRSGKTVTFTVIDAALNSQTFNATTDAAGHASPPSQALGSNVYAVSVAFAGDDFYKTCATAQDTLVTVESAASKVTGGGWISIGTGRTNFGFNAIPEAGGLFKGQFQLRARNGKDRFHGNVVSTLTSAANTATWTGTGTWNKVAGYKYTISVVDNGSSGSKKGDTISITIKSPTNVTVYTSSGSQTLKGGNIKVHQ